MIESDVIIVGGGPVGCVLANKLSNELNLKCLIIEKRNHIAGNCYDEYNKKGLLYHKYGPHYLRFKNRKTLNYLSKFTKWIPGEYISTGETPTKTSAHGNLAAPFFRSLAIILQYLPQYMSCAECATTLWTMEESTRI